MSGGGPGPHGSLAAPVVLNVGNVKVEIFPGSVAVAITRPDGHQIVTAVDTTTGGVTAEGMRGN